MKVNGTGQPPNSGTAEPEESDKAGKAARGERSSSAAGDPAESSQVGKTFGERLEASRPSEKVRAARAPQVGEPARMGVVPVSDVAADLRTGKLSPQDAIEKVLERVVSQQLGADAPPAVRDRVRTALQDALESDPLLLEKLGRLH